MSSADGESSAEDNDGPRDDSETPETRFGMNVTFEREFCSTVPVRFGRTAVFNETTELVSGTVVGDLAKFKGPVTIVPYRSGDSSLTSFAGQTRLGNESKLDSDSRFTGPASAGTSLQVGRNAVFEDTLHAQGGVKIGDGARFKGFASLGENSCVGDRARFEGGAVLGPDSSLGNGVLLKGGPPELQSSIGEGSIIGNNSQLVGNLIVESGCTIGDGADIGSGVTICKGTTICPGATIHRDASIEADVYRLVDARGSEMTQKSAAGNLFLTYTKDPEGRSGCSGDNRPGEE